MKSSVMRRLTQSLLVQPSVRSYLEPLIRLFVGHYRAGFTAARVLKIKKQAGCLWLCIKPSQSFEGFIPGQHVDVSVEIDGRRVQRTFSICSSLQSYQHSGLIELAMKVVAGGQFTGWLQQELRLGDWLYLSQAQGQFTLRQQRPACLIAAGSGITPIRAMLLSISRMTQPITLIYSYRGQAMFIEDFMALAEQHPLFTLITHDTATSPRLTASDIKRVANLPVDGDYYLCGPRAFSDELAPDLASSCHQIYQESFGGFVASAASQQVRFHQQGHSIATQGGGALLQLAEQAGLDPRYGCRRGVCLQCQCQKLSGQVKNLLTGEISSAGTEPIQLCISEALTSVEIQL